ncbi:hypothetical protein C1645_842190 [Glomus cerebriforme]|uniref:Uncharacterized protein n=1 Tax=Glomus cerebriforme TaxID=658196 RepID=A0A397S2A3_9GLOM|nr:hypothetical protein C1645_842190 [Glomus cerebriforme]
MGGGSSNGSSPVGSLSSSVWTGKGKRFSELFSLKWEGKMALCAFGSILESETVLFAFGLTLLRFGHLELGNGSWISWKLLRSGFFLILAWKSDLLLDLTNVLTERFFSFVDSALETKTETFAPGLGKLKYSVSLVKN